MIQDDIQSGEIKPKLDVVKSEDIAPASPSLLADDIIKTHVILGMTAGVIPFPLIVDMIAVTGIELLMITKLARAYSFPVPTRLVTYKILISILGGIGPVFLSVNFNSWIKGLPLAGHLLYAGTLSISGGASVYAVGKLFQKHFESGGTFLSSNNATLKHYFTEKYQEGKKIIPTWA